ncbi:MAG: hypothetical protein ACWGPN_02655 [Gammaproteobacteria bacterium]
MTSFRNVQVLAGLAILASGCATIEPYTLVSHGSRQIGDVEVSVAGVWNNVPDRYLTYARDDAEVWTRDGVLLDRFIVIPGVQDGQPLFRERDESGALPVFHPGMLPHELAELTESSLVKLLGEGTTIVTTDNLRPHRFGEDRGVMFDFTATTRDGPRYRGVVGTIAVAGRLYVLMYLAVDPYYFDKTLPDAIAQIETARVRAG